MGTRMDHQVENATITWALVRPILGTIVGLSAAVIGWVAVEVRQEIAIIQTNQVNVVNRLDALKDAVEKGDGRLELRMDQMDARIRTLERGDKGED